MNETERLRATVQDERARRHWMEQRLTREVERVAIWRRRAEERAARISDLQVLVDSQATSNAPRKPRRLRIRGLLGAMRRRSWSRGKNGLEERVATEPDSPVPKTNRLLPETGPMQVHPTAPSTTRPSYPSVRVAVLGGADLPFLREFEIAVLPESRDALYDADVVFVAMSALSEAPSELANSIAEWSTLAARQPLAVWMDAPVPEDPSIRMIVEGADRRLLPGDQRVPFSDRHDGVAFDAGFDVSLNNPIGWSPSNAEQVEDIDGLRIWSTFENEVVAASSDSSWSQSRVTELLASGVPVFGSANAPAESMLIRVPVDTDPVEAAEAALGDVAMLMRLSVVGRRRAYRESASDVRARSFLEIMGVDAPPTRSEVGALLLTNRPGSVLPAVEAILSQVHASVSLVIGLHGDPSHFDPVRGRLADLEPSPRVLDFGAETTLGEALNRAAAACSSPVLAKFDDDDWYGPHYLEDALAALRYSGADLVGKARHFVEIEHDNDTYLIRGPEEEFANHVIGSSMVFRRRLWEDVPFPHRPSRVDSILLRGARSVGATIYSNSRFEFGVRRRSDGHTWIVDPTHFAARGERVSRTLHEARINVMDDEVRGLLA